MSFILRPHPFVDPKKSDATIKEVRALVFGTKTAEKEGGGGADYHSQKGGHWITDTPIANPMSPYEAYKKSRTSWGIGAMGTMVVEVELECGIVGFGVSIGGDPGCFIVEKHLSRFIEGQDIRNVELMWDQMWRASTNYGRKGLTIQAISCVDLAIWDALGKFWKKPVYQLLGGKTKDRLPVYGTTARPDLAKKMGFVGAKIPLPYGPGDGDAGMKANIERIKKARAAVGEDYPLMIDCYMALTVPYTVELARKIDKEVPGGVKWLEEFLPPDQYDGYAEVRQRVNTTLLTTGEHEYTRWGFKQLLDKNCCDVIQPDISWLGGITEARRIVALASAYDKLVIPHGSSVYSYHLQYAFVNCPMAEFLIMSPAADKIQPLFGDLFLDEPLPKDGFIDLDPERHGFGVTLNPKINLVRPYKRTPKTYEEIRAEKQSRCVDNKKWLEMHSTGVAKLSG